MEIETTDDRQLAECMNEVEYVCEVALAEATKRPLTDDEVIALRIAAAIPLRPFTRQVTALDSDDKQSEF